MSGCYDGNLYCMDMKSQEPRKQYILARGDLWGAKALAFIEDFEKMMLIAGSFFGKVFRVDVERGKVEHEWLAFEEKERANALRVTRSGRTIFSACSELRTVKVWEVRRRLAGRGVPVRR